MPLDCGKGTVVLDAAGLFAGVELSYGVFYVTEGVLSEVIDSASRLGVDLAIASRKLVIVQPPRKHIARVKTRAGELGLLSELSDTDIELLALADYVRETCGISTLYTDDKLVQDVALALGIGVRGVKYLERSRPRKYIYRCRVCGYRSPTPGECPRCGSSMDLEESR